MSRIELEQTLAANEQTGPINREMRNLISSLQNHNRQLKAELHRYKRKFKDSQTELTKLKLSVDDMNNPGQDSKPVRVIHTCIHAYVHVCIHTYACAYIRTYITRTRICAYILTRTYY